MEEIGAVANQSFDCNDQKCTKSSEVAGHSMKSAKSYRCPVKDYSFVAQQAEVDQERCTFGWTAELRFSYEFGNYF